MFVIEGPFYSPIYASQRVSYRKTSKLIFITR